MTSDSGKGRLKLEPPTLKRVTLILIALAGVAAAVVAIFRTDDDPLAALLGEWPIVLAAGLLYLLGMCVYSMSWATLFEREDNRILIALGFLISQPVKYLPGGVAQPIGQVTLAAQASSSSRRAVVSFPVHVLINVVAAMTLGAPLLFITDMPSWVGWLVVLVPITWAALDRRWMTGLLSLLGRLHDFFKVSHDLPAQRAINRGFALALLAHGTLFASFGVLTSDSVSGWSAFELATAYAVAWLIGYIAIPAPAGLGAREAVLAVILSGAASTVDVLKISAVHRIATLIVELALLVVALIMTRTLFRRLTEMQHNGKRPHSNPTRRPATNDLDIKGE